MMKKIHLLFLLIVFTATAGFTQPPRGGRGDHKQKREQIQAQKIAFIADQINLTPEEAQEFWPVYNVFEDELDALHKKKRSYMKELKKSDNLSDERAYELFELIFKTEKQESDIRLKYLKEFSSILGKRKAANVFIAEEKFKRELLRKLKADGNPPPPEHGRP